MDVFETIKHAAGIALIFAISKYILRNGFGGKYGHYADEY